MVQIRFRRVNGLALRPVVGLVCFRIIGQGTAYGKTVVCLHGSAGIRIPVFCVRLQIIGIARYAAGLPPLVLGPGIVGRIGDGDDAFPLVVENVPHVHIQRGFVRHSDIRCAVRRQNPAVAGTGDLTCQIDLTALGVDVFHHQLVGRRIPIDLRHIVKDFVRTVPLGAAIIDLVHGAVLDDSRTAGRPFLRLSQIGLRHRSCIVLVAALDQAVHIDVGGRHINIPPGNVAGGRLGGSRPRVGCCTTARPI